MITSVSKGYQITIPAKIRKRFGLDIGTQIDIEDRGKEIVVRRLGKEGMEELFEESKKYRHKLTPRQLEKMEEEIYD